MEAKQTVRDLLEKLPDDCTLDDVLYHLYVIQRIAQGDADIEAGRTMQEDAIFRIYSMTKPITSIAIMILLEEGRLGLTDVVRFHGSVSHHALREKPPAMDAGFLATRLDAMTRYSLSTKLLEYVHMGVPVIAPRIPTYLEYFPEQVFFYYRPDDADDAARALAAFAASSPDERIARARAALAR